jgi:hypothetical protein
MSDATPISGVAPPGANAAGVGGQQGLPIPLGTVSLQQLPANLQFLNRQALLTGQIFSVDQGQATGNSGNLYRLATSAGDVLIQTPLNLRPGTGFLLQIPAGNPPQTGILLSANSLALTPEGVATGGTGASLSATALNAGLATGSATPTLTPPPLPLLQAGLTTPAQLLPSLPAGAQPATASGQPGLPAPATGTPATLPPSAPSAAPPASAQGSGIIPATAPGSPTLTTSPTLPAGASLTPAAGSLLSGTPASPFLATLLTDGEQAGGIGRSYGANEAAARSPLPAPSTGAANSAGGSAATTSSQAFAQANNLGSVSILAIARPGEALPALSGTPGSTVLTATVVQSNPEGPTLLKFGEQVLMLQAKGDFQPGTKISLSLPGNLSLSNLVKVETDPLLAAGKWQTLQETQQFLQAVQSAAAQPLSTSIPQIGQANLGTSIVFFMTALRLGDIRAWLGDNTQRSLEKYGNKPLLDRLSGEFGRLSSLADEPMQSGWRALPVPLSHQNEVGLVNFYVKPVNPDEQKQEGGDGLEEAEGGREGKGGTRFLIDLNMSQLGPMQIDGMAQEQRIDLVMRSQSALPQNMRQELQALYRGLLEARGLQGGIMFRGNAEGWVKLTPGKQIQETRAVDSIRPMTA